MQIKIPLNLDLAWPIPNDSKKGTAWKERAFRIGFPTAGGMHFGVEFIFDEAYKRQRKSGRHQTRKTKLERL